MRFSHLTNPITALSLAGLSAAYPHDPQPVMRDGNGDSNYRAEAVKEAFQHAWQGYRKYAFPHDELHPVSNSYGDSRYALGCI